MRCFGCWVLAVALVCSCSEAPAVGTTTTTAAVVSGPIVDGQPCLRDQDCESRYCDHPEGYCGAPGKCARALTCHPAMAGQAKAGCACASTGDPEACQRELSEASKEPGDCQSSPYLGPTRPATPGMTPPP